MLTTRPTLQSPTTRAPTSSRSPVARTTASTAATARPRLAPSASSRPRPAPTSAVSPALLAPPTRTATTVSAREVSGTTRSCPSALSLSALALTRVFFACSTGGFDESCGGDNANCEGFLFCTNGDFPPATTASNTCGGVGSYCQSAYSPASSSSNATDANLIYNQYCASSASRIFLIGPLDRLTDSPRVPQATAVSSTVFARTVSAAASTAKTTRTAATTASSAARSALLAPTVSPSLFRAPSASSRLARRSVLAPAVPTSPAATSARRRTPLALLRAPRASSASTSR